ncbi:phospho-N-acetylmuramoyl-pentapeptide-transferase [Ruficoccus amylovorans]|uniref:Phospho-N-acetylmuramoyl-pentapeptide-transferase n=1 Tax=Ruficoccus amylovorans TaxID=1804625 RepID=A0A842HIM4_9BACT|nr:phospho-N-acetylmuramoyl-pentapeptide-transferase [Ruficoccus amylovorans]MBC2595367.1 phospho-N-acetylmuramoyl-pentapeptide-transferase [Ruficoccus amylovorans]
MLTYLAEFSDLFGPFRLFRFLTFRAVMGAGTAVVVGFIIAPWVFARLRQLKLAQTLRNKDEVGKLADLHAGKKDTPTMGGLMIFASVFISTLLWAEPNLYVIVTMIVYAGLTALGFADDYLKVSKKNSKGLASHWKLAGQGVLTLIALALLLGSTETHLKMSELWVPFLKEPLIMAMPIWFAFIFFFLVMAGSSNAINLTDGVDGLAIGCTVTATLVYGLMAYAAGNVIISDYLLISYIPGSGELAVICSALVGASLVFLWYNSHPATVFMGDTGSLALGGIIGTMAFIIHQPFTLIIVGGIFVAEAISVILQVGSYKLRGKRVFRMAPLHHHFELLGWHENKVVIRFWIISLMCAFAGLATLKLR